MPRFAGVELGEDTVPDETTTLRFRHLLERHSLTEAIFGEVRGLLEDKNLRLQSGTIVDATIVHAPNSTKNETKARDPEMHQSKKGNMWYFGMKVHVGTDVKGLVHHVTVTDAAQPDINQLPDLMHGQERTLYGDKAYWCAGDREAFEAVGVRYRVNRRGTKTRPLSEPWRQINRTRSRVSARGEHAFHVVSRSRAKLKRLWGFNRVRYRGLAKNAARAYTAFALANLYLVRHRLAPPGARYVL